MEWVGRLNKVSYGVCVCGGGGRGGWWETYLSTFHTTFYQTIVVKICIKMILLLFRNLMGCKAIFNSFILQSNAGCTLAFFLSRVEGHGVVWLTLTFSAKRKLKSDPNFQFFQALFL